MSNFELVLNGFDGATNDTDHLILWVSADSKRQLNAFLVFNDLDGIVRFGDDLPDHYHKANGIDFYLPNEADQLKMRIAELTGIRDRAESIVATDTEMSTAKSGDIQDTGRADSARVLVIVSGGVADYAHDNGVACELFDFDNYRDDPVGTGKVPQQFADLAAAFDAPVEDIAGLTVEHAKHDSSQSYLGPIKHASEKFVVQNIGRSKGVIHLAENLSKVPAVGEAVEITYGNGHAAVVVMGKEHGKAVER